MTFDIVLNKKKLILLNNFIPPSVFKWKDLYQALMIKACVFYFIGKKIIWWNIVIGFSKL